MRPYNGDLVRNVHLMYPLFKALGYQEGTLLTAALFNELIDQGYIHAEYDRGWIFTLKERGRNVIRAARPGRDGGSSDIDSGDTEPY